MIKILALLLCLTIAQAQTFDIYTGSYTGDGNDNRTISVADLTGDYSMVIVKGEVNQYAVWRGSAHSADNCSHFYSVADKSNAIQSFSSTGFVVGTDATVNSNTETYHYVAFKGDDQTMQILNYTGDGVSDRVVAASAFADKSLALIKHAGTNAAVWRSDVMGADSSILMTGDLFTILLREMTSAGVRVHNLGWTNTNAQTYHLVLFSDLAHISTTRYKGNGTGQTVSFSPTLTGAGFVLIGKDAGSTPNIFSTTELAGSNVSMRVNNVSTQDADGITTFNNSGATVGSSSLANTNNVLFFMIAFGDLAPATIDSAAIILRNQERAVDGWRQWR